VNAVDPDANAARKRVYRVDSERLTAFQRVEFVSKSTDKMARKIIAIVIFDVEFTGRIAPLKTDDIPSPGKPLFESIGLAGILARTSDNTGSILATEEDLKLRPHRASLPLGG